MKDIRAQPRQRTSHSIHARSLTSTSTATRVSCSKRGSSCRHFSQTMLDQPFARNISEHTNKHTQKHYANGGVKTWSIPTCDGSLNAICVCQPCAFKVEVDASTWQATRCCFSHIIYGCECFAEAGDRGSDSAFPLAKQKERLRIVRGAESSPPWQNHVQIDIIT